MKVTLDILKKVFPQTKSTQLALFVDPINETAAKYAITTELRLAAFLAQTGHESANYTTTKENLNYSAAALQVTFKKYFPTAALAAQYARKPEAIANRVYANRMGNGPESSGDGWKFRGRGLIQLTGKDNISAFARSENVTVDQALIMLDTPLGATMGAGFFWNRAGLNTLADAQKFDSITQLINGGQNGAEDRRQLYRRALAAL